VTFYYCALEALLLTYLLTYFGLWPLARLPAAQSGCSPHVHFCSSHAYSTVRQTVGF